MTFSSPSGTFQLSILGYGEQSGGWRDRNVLRCLVSTKWATRSDSQNAPLQTYDVHRLLGGLKSVWKRVSRHLTITFPQPGLSFDVTALPNEQYRLQVQFSNGLLPAWHPYPDFPLEMDLTLSREQLGDAIQALSGELASYPER